jgi:hypothetical protein
LRKLFLTLFLRGRSSRGLRKERAPKSVGSKLGLVLAMYALIGLMALVFQRQPVFSLSIYLHAMTLVFLGMFVASSAGEILFNKEEADILMHRPVTPRALLWAKIAVLVEVSLWLGCAFNLTGFFVGLGCSDANWFFPVAHLFSTALEALFCTGSVVIVYQLCLRWFGRERLEGVMTTAQVIVSIAAVLSGQIVPRLMTATAGKLKFEMHVWWVNLLPPAWFGGFDDALAGSHALNSWLLGALGVTVTALVLWLAFGKLARDYELGLQTLNETTKTRARPNRTRRRWIDVLVGAPPLRWWLRDPIARASFLLTAAYLLRDRDVKLRIYPGVAPVLVLPIIFLFQGTGRGAAQSGGGFGLAFAGAYLGLIPLLSLNLLRYSQQWQAADLFRIAPMEGPASLCHGTRRAVMVFLTLPMLVLLALALWFFGNDQINCFLMLPGLVALPIYSIVPCMGGKAVPFSLPAEEAKSAGRGLNMIGVMLVAMILSGLGVWAWTSGWFWQFILGETVVVIGVYIALRVALNKTRWTPLE